MSYSIINDFSSVLKEIAEAIRALTHTRNRLKLKEFAQEIKILNKVYYLGEGSSFDIKSLFPDFYETLTVDNFIVEPVMLEGKGGVEYEVDWTMDNWKEKTYANYTANLIKTYEDGILSCSLSGKKSVREDHKNSRVNIYAVGSASVTSYRAYLIVGEVK